MEPIKESAGKTKACEEQLVDMIRTVQGKNTAKGIFGAVSDTQLAMELLVDAYNDTCGIGFEVFARANIDPKAPIEFGTAGYNKAIDEIIGVVNPYLNSLVARGELTREEVPQDETGIMGSFYWVTVTAIMGS